MTGVTHSDQACGCVHGVHGVHDLGRALYRGGVDGCANGAVSVVRSVRSDGG